LSCWARYVNGELKLTGVLGVPGVAKPVGEDRGRRGVVGEEAAGDSRPAEVEAMTTGDVDGVLPGVLLLVVAVLLVVL